jgi:SNF2 family DNA or RNA helicase
MDILAKIRKNKAKKALNPIRYKITRNTFGAELSIQYQIASNQKSHFDIKQEQKQKPTNFWKNHFQDIFHEHEAFLQKIPLQINDNNYSLPLGWLEKFKTTFKDKGEFQLDSSLDEFQNFWIDKFPSDKKLYIPNINPNISLRPYQHAGVRWLKNMANYNLNPILADDMGLGKTLQSLALLQFFKGPHLVIAPSSVVTNWKREANFFFPKMKCLTYQGKNRKQLRWQIEKMDLIVLSHTTLRLDIEYLAEKLWSHVIVDEAHILKNASSQTSKALHKIQCQHKVALTGTPIQNHPRELWALFKFLSPNYLGSQDEFNKLHKAKLSLEQEKLSTLKKQIAPLFIRRLKKDVARDLPPKIMINEYVDLLPEQIALYKECLATYKGPELLKKVLTEGAQSNQIEILALLQRLKNICNHPKLGATSTSAKMSGKLNRLLELLHTLYLNKSRVLLFCQSTKMLDILEKEWQKYPWKHLRLDGSTPASQRQTKVDLFQQDPSQFLFMISTKAGGAGLNLTAADTVIFYDHDWNPANDLQAQDRAYRIGQKNTVSIHKLISKGTLEESVVSRQKLKTEVAQNILSNSEVINSEWSYQTIKNMLDFEL